VSGVEEEVRTKMKEKPWHTEGLGNAEWVLVDYVNIVVHVFQRDAREFYALERLWADGKILEYEDEI
jgi:ribosome-associated protein